MIAGEQQALSSSVPHDTDPDYASIISDYLKEFGSSNPIDDEDFFADDVDFSHQYNTNSKISNIPNNFVLHQFEDMRLRHYDKSNKTTPFI